MQDNNIYYKINFCAQSGFCKDFKKTDGMYYWDYRIFSSLDEALLFAKRFFKWPDMLINLSDKNIEVYRLDGKKFAVMTLSTRFECERQQFYAEHMQDFI